MGVFHNTSVFFALCISAVVVLLSLVDMPLNPWLAMGGQLRETTIVDSNESDRYPLTIIDPVGREMVIAEKPRRIVSAILAGDEMLMALVDQRNVVSVTYLVDQPANKNVNGFYDASILRNHGDIEEILSVEPDLVLVAAYSNAASVELLLASGVPVVRVANYHSHQDLRDNVRLLSRVLGVEGRGEQWIAEMDRRIDRVQMAVKNQTRPRVLYYSLGGATRAPGTLMDESIVYAGGYNVVAETGLKGYTQISKEMAISLLPDVILLDDRMAQDEGVGRDQLMNDYAWAEVPAIKNNRVYSERNPLLLSVTPARVLGLNQLARWLHPAVFEPIADVESPL
ncbi:hypothetical protein A9Q99_27475 [Gammaproteobacteria bacterium 45_16_T64]|nr:hypothetical protein A9Q99_27475 [Gammaproteobacteria bacterium 45_16_T64]